MQGVFTIIIAALCIALYASVPIQQDSGGMYDVKGLDDQKAQVKEYYRYFIQVITELEKDPSFKEQMKNVTEEEVISGKIAHLYDLVGHSVRQKLDEIKRLEVEYQRGLIRQKKHHMVEKEVNFWNPVHADNTDTFEKEDFTKLLEKHERLLKEGEKRGHDEFKLYEMKKEYKRRQALKIMSPDERVIAEEKHVISSHKKHVKLHEPGHKAQLEEVWELGDGLDPEGFDPKTLFNLHDKNGDGYLDHFELETFVLEDLEKAYNESDPDTDLIEREEEKVRMREFMTTAMDNNYDGLVSMKEFINSTMSNDFDTDDEWKPLTDEEHYTEEEFYEFQRHMEEANGRHEEERRKANELDANIRNLI